VTMMREINAELLLGRRVLAPDGRSAGRIEEIVAEPQGGVLAVREYHLGSYALMERLAATPFGRAMLDFFYGSELGRSYRVPWDKLDLTQFNLIPKFMHPVLKKFHEGWGTFRIVPVESGRGCPYGCEFCTVTGFFGDSIRFRTNESVVNELLLLKARARKEGGQIAVFFIDDNFAINVKRTKSLLRDIIAANAQVFWVAQISANLLRDEELVDLIAASGGKWVFIGMESVDPANLKDVNKGFNKPEEYAAVLERLAKRHVYAITSFIFGMDNDTPGVAERTLQQVRTWPPGLPIFGLLTPLPATPLYKRLEVAGRLTRPRHWVDFIPFTMAHTPLKMTIEEAHAEVQYGWAQSYSPEALAQAVAGLDDEHLGDRISIFLSRLCFRGIYFPMMRKSAWLWVVLENRRTILKLIKDGLFRWMRPSHFAGRDRDSLGVGAPGTGREVA